MRRAAVVYVIADRSILNHVGRERLQKRAVVHPQWFEDVAGDILLKRFTRNVGYDFTSQRRPIVGVGDHLPRREDARRYFPSQEILQRLISVHRYVYRAIRNLIFESGRMSH